MTVKEERQSCPSNISSMDMNPQQNHYSVSNNKMNPVPTILLHPTSPTSPTSAEGSPFWQTADSNSNNNSSASSESSDQFPTYNSSFSPMNYYTAGAESTSDYRTHRNSLAYDGIVSLRNNLSPPPTNKMRVRHVSFEGEANKWQNLTEDMLNSRPATVHTTTLNIHSQQPNGSILKPCLSERTRSPSLDPTLDLIRNEYSDSPMFVRRHQAEDFRSKGMRMSITSMCDSASENNTLQLKRPGLQPHYSSHSSLGSYIYLPAVTLPPAYSKEENNSDSAYTNKVMMRSTYSRGRRKRSCVYGERRMSAFETIIQQMARHKESCTQRFCQIYVLLAILQISLGFAVSTMAIYLPLTSPSLTYKDATIWSGCPLAISGIIGMAYYMVYSNPVAKSSMRGHILKITFIVLSSISSVLCTVGCITTGIHGTKIANYKFPCQGHKVCTCYYDSDDDITDGLANSTILYTTPIKKVVMMEFRSCDSETGCCDLVFTSIKDCLLLECAFNCIGTCISLWLMLIVWRKRLLHDHRRHSSIAITNGLSYWQNGYGTS